MHGKYFFTGDRVIPIITPGYLAVSVSQVTGGDGGASEIGEGRFEDYILYRSLAGH